MPERQHQHIISNDILIVDDETPNLRQLSELLGREGYQVRPVNDSQLAIDSALAQSPALILLDVRMPEIDGFEVCKRLKQDKHTRDIPIIFITALQDVQDKVRGFEAGCVDFITKPFQEEEVLARVQTHMELRNMQLNLEKIISERTSKLMESESRFRATFEQAAVGIIHTSTDGKFLRVNEKFCELVGYSEDEIRALTFQEITHPDDLDAYLEYVQQILKGEIEKFSMDKRYYRKDSSIIWVNLTVSLVFDREGNPKYFVRVIKDISDRKHAEGALLKKHDVLEHLISAMPDAVFSIKMPERTINWFNDSFNVLGYEPEECVGQSVKKYYANPEDYYTVGDLQKDAIRKGDDMISNEVMALRKDGRVIPVEIKATFFKEKGKLSNITAMIRDITERKLVEDALRESEAKYRELIDNSIVGVFTTTLDGQFLFVNDAMARMFDFDNLELMITKGSLDRWVDMEQREKMLALLQKHGSVANFEAEATTNTDRHIHVLISVKQIGENIIGMVMDITERKQFEEQLLESEEKFRTLVTDNEEIIYIIDKDGTFVLSEGKGLSELGLQPGQVVGKSVFELYKDYPNMLDSVTNALNGETMTTEINVEGNYFSNWHTPYKNKSGEMIGLLGLSVNITKRKKAELKLQESMAKIQSLKDQLEKDSLYLQEEIRLEHNFENIIGQSEALKYVLHRVEQVAPQDSTVLILGETGTGKELIARALHQLSSRYKRPLVKVNCAALPSELIESELFGREKGAYTGATTTQIGRFELAHGSTLFLDEIGELPIALQAKLLRVIESGEFERLGNARTIKSDARIITATNRDLVEEVRNNRFREDLLYRLRIFPITIPPLRNRIDDIPLLVNNFVRLFARIMGKSRTMKISKKSMQNLQSYPWPGNVRELKHVVESSMITAQGNALHFDLPKALDFTTEGAFKSLEEMERQYILEVLQEKNWKIAGEKSASSILDIHPNTLRSRMQKLGIKKP